MKPYSVGALVALLTTCAMAQSDWIVIGETDDSKWEIKPGSLEVSKTKSQTNIAVVVGRVTDRKTNIISLYKWYVSLSDCKRELGQIVSLNIDGSYSFENSFVFGSGNVASSMAKNICGAYTYQTNAQQGKGM